MPKDINFSALDTDLSLALLIINLGVGVLMALLLRWHFRFFGSTLSNREEFAQVFPFILLTTVLIITVVKSSLALSLGLVGALSIVRFRTPIKEPEELAYLFIAIAIGLGLGANQTIPTVVAGVCILGVMALFKIVRRKESSKNIFLSLDWEAMDSKLTDDVLGKINKILTKHSKICDLRRFDIRQENAEATYFIDITSTADLDLLIKDLRQTFPNIGITFLDQNQLPSV